MIRVAIADDHRVVRVGLEQLLATWDDVELVGSAPGGEDAVALCAAERPDVLLLDLSMPDVDGIEVTRRLAEAGAPTRVVVFTSFSDRERIVEALDAGAIGYLLKDAEPDEIHAAVRALPGARCAKAAAVLASAPPARRRSSSRGASARSCRSSSPGWRTSRSRAASGSARRP
jgi:DNA-binding NarL/FixJ family response regulator